MKLYIIKSKGPNVWGNFYPLSKSKHIEGNSFQSIAVHAFFRKKDAKEHLNQLGWLDSTVDRYEIISVTL